MPLNIDAPDYDGPDLLSIEVFEATYNRYYCHFVGINEIDEIVATGSGVFVKYRDRYFVATAGHVLRDLPSRWMIGYGQAGFHFHRPRSATTFYGSTLVDPELPEKEQDFNQYQEPKFCVEHTDPQRDVGLIEIGSISRIITCGNEFYQIDAASMPNLETGAEIEIWGNCDEIISENFNAGRKSQVTRLGTRLLDPPDAEPYRYLADYRQLNTEELNLRHGRSVSSMARRTESRRPHGMSGGPAWKIPRERRTASGLCYVEGPKLIGVQSAFTPGSRIILAKLEDWVRLADSYINGAKQLDPVKT